MGLIDSRIRFLEVRLAGASHLSISIKDRGREIAVISNPDLLRPATRKRILIPEFTAMMANAPSSDVQSAFDEVRGER